MERLSFYDVKGKNKFNSTKYKLVKKKVKSGVRFFAIANAPSKIKAWRIVSKATYLKNK